MLVYRVSSIGRTLVGSTSFRTPGGHRRIRREDFVEFATANGYLVSDSFVHTDSTEQKVVLVDSNLQYIETLKEFLEVNTGLRVYTCSNIFEAGVLVGQHNPYCDGL